MTREEFEDAVMDRILAHDAEQRAVIEKLKHTINSLERCQCEECDNSLEEAAYCLSCFTKQRAEIEALKAQLATAKEEILELKSLVMDLGGS